MDTRAQRSLRIGTHHCTKGKAAHIFSSEHTPDVTRGFIFLFPLRRIDLVPDAVHRFVHNRGVVQPSFFELPLNGVGIPAQPNEQKESDSSLVCVKVKFVPATRRKKGTRVHLVVIALPEELANPVPACQRTCVSFRRAIPKITMGTGSAPWDCFLCFLNG